MLQFVKNIIFNYILIPICLFFLIITFGIEITKQMLDSEITFLRRELEQNNGKNKNNY